MSTPALEVMPITTGVGDREMSMSPVCTARAATVPLSKFRSCTSSPYFLKKPASRATYCCTVTKTGGTPGRPNWTLSSARPAPGSDAEAQALRRARAELARFAIAMVLTTPATLPVEFEYTGEAEAPDGKADVLTGKGPSNFAVQLFLDKKTHRPLMLAYKGVAPQMRVMTRTADGPPDPAAARAAAEHGAASLPPPQTVEINMFLDDYKRVDGVLLPHHVTQAIDGQTNEEWTFKTIKVNPAFKADAFAVK